LLTLLNWEARKFLDTPAPHVYTWNSQAKSHPVGAEFIIMDKAEGVPLSRVWSTMKLTQKLQVLLAMTHLQKQWLSVSFSHYGSLYYKGDVQQSADNYFIKDGKAIRDSEFAIGPATGRDWCDAGRSILDIDKGPCTFVVSAMVIQLLIISQGLLSPSICEQSGRERGKQSGLSNPQNSLPCSAAQSCTDQTWQTKLLL
jgi:hypothetical protein